MTTEVLEGEVVDLHRKRDRNAIRSIGGVELLPPDVETKVVALRSLPAESQASAVTAMLAHSKAGLLTAIAAQDLPSLKEWKAKAGAIQEMAKQLQLGKDMQLDAAEFVRRAERGVGVAIREGQQAGTVAKRGDIGGGRSTPVPDLVRPSELATKSELHGRGDEQATGIYGMTDGVSDAAFEEALSEAREEANLSRTNVARKAHEKSDLDEPSPLPPPVKKTTKARKTVELLAVTLSNLALGVADVDPAEVDRGQLQVEIDSIDLSLGEIRGFIRKVNKQ